MFYKYKLNKFQERMFTIFIYVSYILIIISALNLSQTAPKLLSSLDYYVRIYICLFLLWRFNPLRKIDTFTNLDRRISFTAGVFILTTTILNNYIEIKYCFQIIYKILNFNLLLEFHSPLLINIYKLYSFIN